MTDVTSDYCPLRQWWGGVQARNHHYAHRVREPLTAAGEQVGLGLSVRTARGLKPPTGLPGKASLSTVRGHEAWGRPRSALPVLVYDLGGGRQQGHSFPGLLKFRNVKF